MFICLSCGSVTDEPRTVLERVGEGTPYDAYVPVVECSCGGDYTEAQKCELCGEWVSPYEMIGETCTECFSKHANYKTAIEFAKTENKTIELLSYLLDEDEIASILLNTLSDAAKMPLAKNKIDMKVLEFAKDYYLDFSIYLKKHL